ncbi:MAG: UDP-N-acetylmuramoyl-L-alanyl-D-glutamate--2,6-diaminopimelate ligase, partial [Leptothrix sp. (in: b-proteobacteria)]
MTAFNPSLVELADAAAALAWLRQRVGAAGQLQCDSRQLHAGDAFIAWPGAATDGRAHVSAALAAGAVACLVEADGIEAFGFAADEPRIAALRGLKAATGAIAHAWHGAPGERLAVVASTGTNGKTSTAWWVAQALSLAGQRCGVIGTLGVGEPPSRVAPDAAVTSTGLTTPDPLTLHQALHDFADQGFAACAIEASSIGLAEQRLAALPIRVALFTNFTPDHLDYHADMAAYWAAKRVLFDWPGLRAAVLNRDDPKGAELAAELVERTDLDLWTYALNGPARLRASGLHYVDGGLCFTLHEAAQQVSVRTGLIGDYNAANVLAVIGALRALGVPLVQAANLAIDFTPVPGRMQRVKLDAASAALPQVVVDYAHTPDALDKALTALRPLARAQGGRLWCVFGCGGNRDATKRAWMGAIAARLADAVCVTSDNPRLEDPQAIVAQVLAGIPAGRAEPVRHELDRAAAIAGVLAEAAPNDVVLIAGKGHEDYQDIGGVKRPFSDLDVALTVLRGRAGGAAPVAAAEPSFDASAPLTLAQAHALIARRVPAARLVAASPADAATPIARVHTD